MLQSTYFSASKCLNFFKTLGFKTGKEKMLSLERHSQAAYLFYFNQIFSYKMKDQSQYPRKAYAGDTGFYYSQTGKIDYGKLFENTAFLELKRRTDNHSEICYWKNKRGTECDFVIKKGTNVSEAIQVVYDMGDEKTRKREINGIVECAKELKPKKATILTKDTRETITAGRTKISIMPLMDWLME